MTDLSDRILDMVRANLGADQLSSAIVYLDLNPIRAHKQVRIGDVRIKLPCEAHIAFVDLEPGVNWGHSCVYLAVCRDTNEVIQFKARMPPFLKAETSNFRFLWRGPLAPDWAIVTNPD
jgi:hypothetical protein